MPNESSVLVRLRLLGGARFASEATRASRGLRNIGPAADRVSGRMTRVNRVMTGAVTVMRQMAGGAAILAGAGLAQGVMASVNFEQAMANVQARLLTTRPVMEKLSQQAIKLGEGTAFSANQAAEAMGEFAAAGFNAAQITRIMPGTLNLAAAAGTDLAFAAETTGALVRQFGLKAKDAGHVADLLTVAVNKSAIGMDDLALTMKYVGPVAGRFNQRMEDIGAAAAILGNVGIKGETAGTTLRRALVNLVRPSVRTRDMLADVGVTVGEFNKATVNAKGDLRAMPAILGNLAGHFNELSKPDRRRILTQLFGVEALPGMVTLFDMGEKKIRRMSSQLTNSGGAAKRTAGIMRGTVKGAWDQFTGAVESAQIRLLRGFNPALQKLLRGAAGMVGRGSNFLAGFLGGAGGREIKNVANQVIDAFKPAVPFFQNVLGPLLLGFGKGVLGSVVTAFKILVPVIRVVATVLGWLGTKLAPLRGVFEGIGFVIGFIATGPILKLLGGLKYVGVAFKVLAAPVRIVDRVFRFAGKTIGKLFGTFMRVHMGVLRFVATFRSMPARVTRSALNMVSGVINMVQRLPGRLLSLAKRAGQWVMKGLRDGARSLLGSVGSFFGKVGKAIVDAIVNAIKSAPGQVLGAIDSILPSGVKSAVKKFIPGLASGGMVRRGGVAVVGERGPELAAFPSGTRVHNADDTRRILGARPMERATRPIVLNVNLSGRQIHSEVFRIERQLVEAT